VFNLTCEINIGDYRFSEANQVSIKLGRNILTGTAVVKIANIGFFVGKANPLNDVIKIDDPVEIKLGYDGDNQVEFVGYVSEKRPNMPFEIHCEDGMRMLRRKVITKNYPSILLKDLILELVPDALVNNVPEVTLTDFRLNRANVLEILNEFKTTYPGIDVYFRYGKLYVGMPLAEPGAETVIYDLQKNTIKNNLVFQDPADVKIKVHGRSNDRATNTFIEVVVGDSDGDSVTVDFGKMSREELIVQANEKLKQLKLKSYKGSVLAWGVPFAKHGDVAKWVDRKYPMRQQSNYIDEVQVEWGDSTGFRRSIIPGLRAENK
jgi:hypothetical protein